MMILKLRSRVLAVLLLSPGLMAGVAHAEESQTQNEITLLESFGGSATIPTGGAVPFSVLIAYFDKIRPWIYDVAVGFAVVWILVAGIQFMLSGNNTGKRQEAVSRITWAIIGVLILLFSGFILRSLNGLFFT